MGILDKLSGTTVFLILALAILFFVAACFAYGFLDLKTQQDTATAQTELEAKLEEARREGYLLSGKDVIVAINNQFSTQGFLSLPIKAQDGNFVQVRFYTEQQCATQCALELERLIQGGGQ